jgi:riboflavin synthase
MAIDASDLDRAGIQIGDSIAVSGVCLTAVELTSDGFHVDVSNETLACTTLAQLSEGAPVNLEKSLTLATPLGGHLVSGHVDGIGQVSEIVDEGDARKLAIALPAYLAKYVARKGSICVDGVSLTVNAVSGERFEVQIIPHTLTVTTIGRLVVGSRVNIEVDLIARYLERLYQYGQPTADAPGITREFLHAHGYLRGDEANH